MVDLIKLKALYVPAIKKKKIGKASVLSLLSRMGILPDSESRGKKICLENLINSIHILLLPHQYLPYALKHQFWQLPAWSPQANNLLRM